MDYAMHIVVLAALFAALAVSLDLLIGSTGILSFAHAAFFAIGAYSSAILSVSIGSPFLFGVLVGMTIAVGSSLILSLSSLRLSGEEFVLVTFAFQIILFNICNSWMGLTNGPLGIAGIPAPAILGMDINSPLGFALLAVGAFGITIILANAIVSSPLGRVLRAIREDEDFAKSLGKMTSQKKVTVFAVSSALAAITGSIYAHYMSYIDPTSFSINESILVVSMVVIGGPGTRYGPALGAVLLVTLPEGLRFIGLPDAAASHLRQVVYGVALVVVTFSRPRGLSRVMNRIAGNEPSV